MSTTPVGPVTGVPPATPVSDGLRVVVLAQAQAVLETMLDGAATPEAQTAAKAQPGAAAAGAPTSDAAPAGAPPNPVAQAVDVARASAAQRQGSLAPLFADLAQALRSPALPPALRAVVTQVLALQTPLQAPLTAETVHRAVAQSGLFLEAHLAQAPPAAPPQSDLKAALLTLRAALAAQPEANPPAPAPTATTQKAPTAPTITQAPASAPGPAPVLATPQPPSAPSALAAPTDPKAALLSLQIAATDEPAAVPPAPLAAGPTPAEPPAAAPTQPPPAAAQAPRETPPVAGEAPANPPPSLEAEAELSARLTLLDEPPEPAAPSSARSGPQAPNAELAAAIPPPPHRAAALAAQPAQPSGLPAGARPAAIVERLQTAVEQAVARQTLHQLASLPDGGTSAWMFELPLATPQGTAIAQFEIQRDGHGQQGEQERVNGWRLRFSIDIEPLGPVHIHLGLKGDQAQVVVWAEREASLKYLQSAAGDLSRALPAEVVFHPGAPRRPTPAPGQFMDQSL